MQLPLSAGTQRSRCRRGVALLGMRRPLCSLKAAFLVRRRMSLPSERSVYAAGEALHLSDGWPTLQPEGRVPWQPRSSFPYFAPSAASIASIISGESGFTLDSKRLMILPSRPTRNLLKFQRMSPG